ncbi:hypothetical protein J1N35_026882 [Gossypium stocksii]|uniref:DUF4283 domain-containing protein n=1 Tax=Gossypium stocksii TaxID=47602 RepID=A0A9D3ZZ77_9ROSI|nr:hypothetical protein J1N35_026882 [Gossypium stocksii]
MSSLSKNSSSDKSIVEELIPKKVRFRRKDVDTSSDMMVDLSSEQHVSWKEKLVGQHPKDSLNRLEEREDLEILEGDVQKSLVNRVPAITFPDRIHQILIQAFDPSQAFPSVVMAWIRFPGLPGYRYNHKIITEIRGMVGKVVKLDMNTDNRARGRFARMVIYADLDKPLVSQILINVRKQTVEYESLLTICFHCRRYGHMENFYTFRNHISTEGKNMDSPEVS